MSRRAPRRSGRDAFALQPRAPAPAPAPER
jgi:hypothetical protein